MIHREKKATLTTERLLEEMHMQWHLAGRKSKDNKDSNDKNEIALAANNTKKRGKKRDGKEKKENPNKDKTCNHCKKKGHLDATCWEKHPEKMPKKVKAARSKAKSEGSKKTSVATAAIEDEGEIILVAADHDVKDAYTCVPIKEETDYIFLDDGIESNEEEESEENTDFNIHDLLLVEEVAAEVWIKVAPKCQSKLQTMEMYKSSVDVDLQHSDVDEIQGGDVSLVVMSETTLQPTMEALVDKNMWIADTGATSHVTNSKVGGKNHCNPTVKTRGFVGESINPDLEMDIPVTYMCENGDEIEAEFARCSSQQNVQLQPLQCYENAAKGIQVKRGCKINVIGERESQICV
jgi:hypothetical protein